MSNIERRMSASAQIIKQITIEGYYTSITFELQSMDRLGKDVVRSLAARSRRQPENEMLGPFRAYRRIILCRDLRLNYHRRILRFGRRAREISRPGVSWGRNGLENHHFLVHIPQLRTKKLLTPISACSSRATAIS